MSPGAWVARNGSIRVVWGAGGFNPQVVYREGSKSRTITRGAFLAWVRRNKAQHCGIAQIKTDDHGNASRAITAPCDRCGESIGDHRMMQAVGNLKSGTTTFNVSVVRL